MPAIVSAVLCALVAARLAAGTPPSEIEAERAACKRACVDEEPEGTDRTTCTLVCDTAADNRLDGPAVTRTRTETRMGGPLPGVPVGHPDDDSQASSTTTVTTPARAREPSLTTAARPTAPRSTAGAAPGPDSVAWPARLALATCQARCDADPSDASRWACKRTCLHRHPTPKAIRPASPRPRAPVRLRREKASTR